MRNIGEFIKENERALAPVFSEMDEVSFHNQTKVLAAFRKNRVAIRHFTPTTGYGYGDEGRDTLGRVFADAFGAEACIASPHLLSGTHALTVALFGLLYAGDTLLSVTGEPYDTLSDLLHGKNIGSFPDYGIGYRKTDLIEGEIDREAVRAALSDKTVKVVFLQRSRGYEWRDALSPAKIGEICAFVRSCGFDGCIFCDNCYGEFTAVEEPNAGGVDVCVGSLNKNPGGGIAPTGGYILGKQKYIDRIAGRLTSPSIGLEVGSYAYGYQPFYQGFFLAPHTVAQAVKGSLLIGKCLSVLGYATSPSCDYLPSDITRAVRFENKEELLSFIQAVQTVSPVDSYLSVEPWDMPGYADQVVMAAGTFMQGATLELSADAPVRKPYIAYFQGGLTYEHVRCALTEILENL